MKINSRFHAFIFHLAISVILFLGLLAIILTAWYPNGLIFAGGITGLKIVISVDLILGPLLTLVVFKKGKKGLKFDLVLIATMQLACMLYGTLLVYNERPTAQILIDDGIYLLSHAEANEHEIDLVGFSGDYPKRIMMNLPNDESTWQIVKFTSELADGKSFFLRSDLYLDLDDLGEDEIRKRISLIIANNSSKSVPGSIPASGKEECVWIPIISTHTQGHACFNLKDGIIKLNNDSKNLN